MSSQFSTLAAPGLPADCAFCRTPYSAIGSFMRRMHDVHPRNSIRIGICAKHGAEHGIEIFKYGLMNIRPAQQFKCPDCDRELAVSNEDGHLGIFCQGKCGWWTPLS